MITLHSSYTAWAFEKKKNRFDPVVHVTTEVCSGSYGLDIN